MGLVHLVVSIFLIAFIPACLAGRYDKCPPPELSTPCKCAWWDPARDDWGTWTQGKNYLYCQNVSRKEVIPHVLTRTKDYAYDFLSVISPNIENLSTSIFEIRNFTRLFVLSASMRSLFDGTPTARYLRELYANKVELAEPLQWDLFDGMPNLERFTFTNSPSLQLDDQFVEHAPKTLVRINISNCSLSELPINAFQAMDHLTHLKIDHGRIDKLEKTMFPSQIQEFSFQNQRIREVPLGLFDDMSELRWLSLPGNLISKLPEGTFGEPIKRDNLAILDLRENPIDCDSSLGWIASLDDSNRNKLWGECAKPKNMHGKQLKDLTPEDFN